MRILERFYYTVFFLLLSLWKIHNYFLFSRRNIALVNSRGREREGNNKACLELAFHRWWYAYSIVNSGKIKNSPMKILAFDAPVIRVEHEDRIIGEIEHAHAHGEISFALIPEQRGEKYSNLYKTNSSISPVYLKWIVPISFDIMDFRPANRGRQRGWQTDFFFKVYLYRYYFFFRHNHIFITRRKYSTKWK